MDVVGRATLLSVPEPLSVIVPFPPLVGTAVKLKLKAPDAIAKMPVPAVTLTAPASAAGLTMIFDPFAVSVPALTLNIIETLTDWRLGPEAEKVTVPDPNGESVPEPVADTEF